MILIVPCCEPGKGGGHLSRCIALTKDLRAIGKDARLFITPQTRDLTALYKSYDFNPAWCVTNNELEIRNKELREKVDFIVLDNLKTTREEIKRWKNIAPVIGIDEGGAFREEFDFLIDMLIPLNFIKPAANITSPSLLIKDLTQRRKEHKGTNNTGKKRILISFGQEDTAGLGLKTAQTLSALKDNINLDITLLRGALAAGRETVPENIKVLQNIPNLSQHLHEYDLVITHYGLTAYEALFAGTKVLLDHPTPYHRKIAKAAGFETLSWKKITTEDTELHRGRKINPTSNPVTLSTLRGLELKDENLAELINTFSPIIHKSCPVCGAETGKSITRFSERTYRKCKKCGVIYMDRINEPPIEYEKDYFFESYKKQYGKTYLEDFDSIKQAGKQRLKFIKKVSRQNAKSAKAQREEKDSEFPTLLDIGCAYGPFLAAAKEEGFSPTGIDPAQDAVQYVNEKLGIKTIHSLFPAPQNLLPAPNSIDVISLWYVIEHFRDCVSVLSEVKKLLKPNGCLAFSTPSFSGISGHTSLEKFLSASPADHFTVWSPKMVKKALALAGFKVKKIVAAGHHPERFPLLGKFAKSKKSLIYKILMSVSKLFGLGDTFEVYAHAC